MERCDRPVCSRNNNKEFWKDSMLDKYKIVVTNFLTLETNFKLNL